MIAPANRLLLIALLAALIGSGCESDQSEARWPSKPIKVVVPFGSGGGSDTFARQLIRSIETRGLLDQPMVVINVAGAGGTIGSRRVRDARPDGYTMLMLHEGILTAHHAGRAPYGPGAFEAVAGTGNVPMVVTVATDSPIRELGDLMEEAVDRSGELKFAANIGAPSHFGGLLLEATRPGAAFRFVQYGGGADRFGAITGGHVDLSLFSVEEYLRYREGGLRALAVFAEERHPALPEVPTAREADCDVISSNMHFWWMPKNTPPEIVEAMAAVIEEAMTDEAMRAFMAASWTEPVMLEGQALADELERREQSIARVSLREIEGLPNFPLWIGCLTGLLFVANGAYSRLAKPVEKAAGTENPARFTRLSATAYLLTGVYVLVLALGWLAYPWATVLFVAALGVLIGARSRPTLAGLAVMAVLMGFGLFLLFTRVLVVDLPG